MKGRLILFCLTLLCALKIRTALALRCNEGYAVQSWLYTHSDWNEVECQAGERCVRLKGAATVYYWWLYYLVGVQMADCINEARCIASCEQAGQHLLDNKYKSLLDEAGVTVDSIDSCLHECCNWALCNSKPPIPPQNVTTVSTAPTDVNMDTKDNE